MSRYPLLDVWCNACGTRWLVPSTTSDGDLHVFHDRELAEHVFLDVYKDAFFDEVAHFVDEISGEDSVSSGSVRDFHRVLTELADRDRTGGRFKIVAEMSCPVCAAERLAFRPTDPPQFFTEELPPLRHERWSALSKLERIAEVKKALGK